MGLVARLRFVLVCESECFGGLVVFHEGISHCDDAADAVDCVFLHVSFVLISEPCLFGIGVRELFVGEIVLAQDSPHSHDCVSFEFVYVSVAQSDTVDHAAHVVVQEGDDFGG